MESIDARLLEARASLRLGIPAAALGAIAKVASDANRERAEIALLRGVAQSRLDSNADANDLFRDAFVYSVSAGDQALELEVEYYKALTAFGQDDLIQARETCEKALQLADNSPASYSPHKGIVPIEHLVSRTQVLLGVIDAAEGRYGALLMHARIALKTLDSCSIPDVFQEAFALKNLSILARDFDIEEDAALLAKRIPSFAWTKEICLVEFTTVEALGWCSALRGDATEALHLFRRAETAASTDPERILVGVDRALIAREFGHHPLVAEEVVHALNLADAFDWEHATGDTRDALLSLAQAAAPITPSRARAALDRYTGIRTGMDPTFAARIEPRARAEEAYTHGLVLRAEGRLHESTERLTKAFATWESIGYAWRAARAALELAELDAGDVFRLAVRRELVRRPNSVFSTRARLVA